MRKILVTIILSLNCFTAWSMGSRMPSPTDTGSPSPPSQNSAPPARWIGKHSQAQQWTDHSESEIVRLASDALYKNLVDMPEFCTQYPNLRTEDKINFWVYLLSSMTEFESGFNPNTRYTESFNDSQGRPVISRGLLQLSIESANGYGCRIQDAQELHDAKINLSCALRIINKWAKQDSRIAGKVSGSWRGSARYWSVLRNEKGNTIRSWTKAYCQALSDL